MEVFNWAIFLLSKLLRIEIIVNEGILEGQVVTNPYGSPFFSFEGIPYAEPPIGELRFKAPQPKTAWEGIRTAKERGSKCYHYEPLPNNTGVIEGSEDCLYLNVYSPNIAPINPLPVMVWIHGGGFTGGSADEYRPEYLIRKGVVMVNFNYRLEVLGFLSLDTEDIPGNAGMKDQVAALRWVKQNIRKFGGDPDNITIFGESAGGASVSFHLVSPMSKGLFKRAIVQSGSLTCWWPNTFRARDRALNLARELGCDSNDDKEIYEFFKSQPVEKLIARKTTVTYIQWAKESPNVYFGIVSEREFGGNERFFFGHPYEVLRNGIHEGVQIMNGYTEDEGVMYFDTDINPDKVFEQANNFIEFFVPEPYTTNVTVVSQIDIGKRFREFYLQDKIASKETLEELLKYFNIEVFVYGIIALQKLVAITSETNNYLYKFTCKSELNDYVVQTGVDHLFDYRIMVAHADDLGYMFPSKPSGQEIDMNSNTFKMIEQVTTLWTNFAKYGDPTPDDNLGAKWLPFTLDNQEYLDIGEELVPGTFPEKDDMEFWENNFKEFLPKLVP